MFCILRSFISPSDGAALIYLGRLTNRPPPPVSPPPAVNNAAFCPTPVGSRPPRSCHELAKVGQGSVLRLKKGNKQHLNRLFVEIVKNSYPTYSARLPPTPSPFFSPLHTRTDLGAMCSPKFNWPLIVNIIHQASNGHELLMCAAKTV